VHIANLGERCVQDLVGKPEGQMLLGRPRHRWENNIEMSPKMWDEGHRLNRCDSGWRQLLGSCECDKESSGYTKWKEFLDYLRTC
jgi:hypothetical protein